MSKLLPHVNIDEPRWDQSTYWGRAKYFFTTTNPLNIFCSSRELDRAKTIVDKYRQSELLEGCTIEDVYRAKELVDSAFHPDTGEKMFVIGRMSAQVPMNMIITGCMVTFYRSTPAVIFWQWVNQSFNALVNYTNRSGKTDVTLEQLGKSYVLATGGALGTALTLNKLAKRAPPLIGRLVPFAAVAAANCINIPFMRFKELENGIPVYDSNAGLLLHTVIQLVFPFLSQATKELVFFHKKVESLHEHISPSILPAEYGGEKPPLDPASLVTKYLDAINTFTIKSKVHSMYIEPVIPEEVLSVINSLSNTTPGIDGFNSDLMKNIASGIRDVLCHLVNLSFQSGVFPKKLKNAVVVPIYKGGLENKCSNYRPISLLPCFSKVYEKLMKQKLINFLQSTNFFINEQFGFRTGMNTEGALVNFVTDIYYGLISSKCVSGLL